jgi:hypothetical protein
MATPSGVPVTGQAAINLQVACGADPNQFRPILGLGTITRLENKASSLYHSMQVAARKNLGGLELSAAYTYSHSIDDSSDRYDGGFVDSYNLRSSRASSNFDIRHLLNVSYVYDLPFFKGKGLQHAMLGGWQVSGIVKRNTGLPFTVTNAVAHPDNAGVGNGVGTASYPDLVRKPGAGVRHGTSDPSQSWGPLYYDPSLFTQPRGLTFGNAGRNSLRSPGRTNFDMALFKHFAIKENMAFEFRAEAFNVFNHTQWAPIAGAAGSAGNNGASAGTNSLSCVAATSAGCSSFLHLNSAYSARLLQLGAKFIF